MAGVGGYLVGNPQHGEAVQPVGGQFQIQDGIPQVLVQLHPHRRVLRQNHDALVAVTQTQFHLRADHTLRNHPTNSGRLEGFPFSAVGIEKTGAHLSETHFLSSGYIRGSADHLHFPVARTYPA